MKRCKYVLLFVISFLSCSAQTYKGRVIDSATSAVLESVSVSLLDKDNMTLCFTISQDDGLFMIDCQATDKIVYMHVARLGYKPQTISIKDYVNDSQIQLEKSDIALKEVHVKYHPIKKRGDTINFDAGAFRLDQDKHIKDILKRLPGIEVDVSGAIKYQGKSINKFYVENMDLTDGRYNLISNNLGAKTVKTIQVLENHQPVKSLRGIDFSDQAALNLLLEDESKGKFFGSVDIGAGVEGAFDQVLWESRLIGFVFNNKLQSLVTYKNTNTGLDIQSDLTDFGTSGVFFLSGRSGEDPDLFGSLGASVNTGFKKSRSFFNDAHYVSANVLTKLSDENQLRVQASYFHEKEKQNSESVIDYFLPDATMSLVENRRAKNVTNQADVRLSYELSTDQNYLKNTLDVKSRFGTTNKGTITGTEHLFQQTDLDKLSVSNDFAYTHRFSEHRAFRISSVNSFNRLPQRIIVKPGLYEQLVGDSTIQEAMGQSATLQSFKSHTFTSFSHRLGIFNLDYDVGLRIKTQALKSSPDEETALFLNLFADSLRNRFQFTELNAYVSPVLKYKRSYLNISLALNTELMHLYGHDSQMFLPADRNTFMLFKPSFRLQYDIDAYWNLNISSRYSKSYSDIYSLYSGYLLKSYRSLLRHDDQLSYSSSFSNSASLGYKHPIHGLFIYINGGYSVQQRNTLNETVFNGVFQQTTKVKKHTTNDSYSASLSLSKTLPFWSSVLDAKYHFMNYEYSQILSGEFVESRSTRHQVEMSFTVAPLKQLNFEGVAEFSFNSMKSGSLLTGSYPTVKETKLGLAVHVIPIKTFYASWSNDLYLNNINGSPAAFFSDISFSYSFKNSEIQLSLNNIFNEKQYKRETLGSYYASTRVAFLHERQFLVKYLFNF